MWQSKGSIVGKKGGRNGLVAVAIDRDKSSQHAMKWTLENLLAKGQTAILIHVIQHSSLDSSMHASTGLDKLGSQRKIKDLFLTYHCFCMRKDVECIDVVLQDMDIAKAIAGYISHSAIETLVVGTSRHGLIRRLKSMDVPTSVSKGSPDFCTVYVVNRNRLVSVRSAARMAPFISPLLNQIQQLQQQKQEQDNDISPHHMSSSRGSDASPCRSSVEETEATLKEALKMQKFPPKMFSDFSNIDSDISFISTDRSSSTDRMSLDRLSCGTLMENFDQNSRLSTFSYGCLGSLRFSPNFMTKGNDGSPPIDVSSMPINSINEDVEAEMRRLKLELQKTMEMYSTACKEALTAKRQAVELHQLKMKEEQRLQEETLMKWASRLGHRQEQSSETESEMDYKRMGRRDSTAAESRLGYRRYTFEEIKEATNSFDEAFKIGEGGYGPVYKCYLDHTPVAVKVLRPNAAQGMTQFQKEVEVLCCLRHPNMVLLLGACPEYGCLVYEHMANGSLADRLLRKDNTRPLSWQLRFKIAAEIATGLHFLHQTKPEPLVHRDLKPANILLDQNNVSKISDVGLGMLVPPSVADGVTKYRLTSAAGTLSYIDPEYQWTGKLVVQSDIYSFGVVLLQILTGKPASGLIQQVGQAIESGMLEEVLDPCLTDWPIDAALVLAKLALQCTERRWKDRQDLGKFVIPKLNKLRELSEQSRNNGHCTI